MNFGQILTLKRMDKTKGFYTTQDYVYLADIGDNTYLAKILDDDHGKQVIAFSEKNQKYEHKIQFYIVQLTTDSFNDRIVCLNKTITDAQPRHEEIREELNQKDKVNIKNEIMNADLPVELKNYVSSIELE